MLVMFLRFGLVWSRAAEASLADAYCFSGGPAPCHGLVLGRGLARFRRVRLGGSKVRNVRCNTVDVHDAADVFLYRDSSISPLLDLRRRFKAVLDVLSAMIRYGVSLSLSVELTAQWDRILAIGPLFPVTLGDLQSEVFVLVSFIVLLLMFIVVLVISFMQLLFIGGMRLFGGGGIGFVKILWFIFTSGFGLIWFLPHPFFSASLILLLVVRVCYLLLIGLMRNSERPGFLIYAALGKGIPALRNSIRRFKVGYLCCLSLSYLG